MRDEDQELVAAILASMPQPDVPADFLSRVNARIDQTAGWLGLADFRLWTLRLAPLAAALGVLAVLWPAASTTNTAIVPATTAAVGFSPASAADWQKDVSADALLEAALQSSQGSARVR
jgi:hypothetical protein